MKKKLIQILMLMVATVSVGSFVSCKDTSEDLYNELRTQNLENASVAEALEARIKALETLVAGIKSCDCDTTKMLGWVNAEDAYLQSQIDKANAAIAALEATVAGLASSDDYYTKAQVDKMIADLADLYAALADFTALKKDFDTYVITTNADVKVLQDKVKELEDALKEINSCKCDLEKLGILEGRLIEAEANAKEALDGLKAIEDIAKAAQAAADAAQAAADKAQKTADDATTLANEAKTAASEAKTLAEACQTLLNSALTTANEAKTIATEAKTLAESNKGRIEKLEADLQTLDGKVNVVSDKANQAIADAAAAAAKADANKELIDALTKRVEKAESDINTNASDIATNASNIATNKANIESLQEAVKGLQTLAEQVGANSEAIATLKESIKETNTKLNDLDDKYTELKSTLEALKTQVEDCQKLCAANLEVAKAELRTEIQDLEKELLKEIAANTSAIAANTAANEVNKQAIEDLAKQHEADVEWIKEALRQISAKADGYVTTTDLAEVLARLTKLENTDKNLNQRLKTAETTLKNLEPRVKKLENNVAALWDHMKVAEDKLNNIIPVVWGLKTDVAAIQAYLRSQVTGLLVQGTYNPMFGSFSIPANIQSNVLVAYYGKPKTKVEFPTTDDANYVRKKEALTDADWAIISDGLTVFKKPASTTLMNVDEEGNANAGKVYVTVNPTSFDATGLQLELVNTQDVVSPIKLSPLQKSDATLQFGFSRADNGFYEANASIKKENLQDIELAFDQDRLEDAIKEARLKMAEIADNFFNTTGASGDLGGIATKVYNVIHDMRIDQSGLKCPYVDFNGKDQALYSQYNIAATVLRPLSLASFKDLDYATIPGYEDMNEFLDKIAATLNDHVHVIFTDANGSWKVNHLFNGLIIDGMSLEDYTDNLIAHFKTRVSHFSLNGINYELTIPGTGGLDVRFDKNLKANGNPVNVPAAVAYDESNPALTNASIVIGGDVVTGMTTALVIPAIGGDGVVSAYAYIELVETSAKATLVGSDIQLWSKKDGTFTVATYTGSSVEVTAARVVLKDLVGSEGYVDVPVAREIAGDAQKIVDLLEKFLEEMNHTLAEINKYDDIIAGENGWINKFINQYIRKYLDKINHTTVYFFNSINRRFGPFLCASNDYKGFKRLSTSKYAPTTLNKEGLKLYPTTKNMELIVPIARKHVAITDVFDEAGTSAKKDGIYKDHVQAINNMNENLNKVLDGTDRMIAVDTSKMKSGYTYEIAYSVLDFEGNISTSKYYVKIAE
ncbi:MAG: hypothetical protein IKQ07_02860 [Bacteroidaceae bacterium]|nr:hypothetical protein [Bacteroidaceae bacterium]